MGKCIMVGDDARAEPPVCRTVIGVVRNSPRFNVVEESAAMQFFLPLAQGTTTARGLTLRLREGVDPQAAIPLLQRELVALDPSLRTVNLTLLAERVRPQMREWELGATMFSIFGAVALLVASIGLYSVLAFGVAQRTLELGIRSALGADRRRLLWMVVRQGVALAITGVAIGTIAALILIPRIEHLLYDVSPRDPMVFGVVAALLLAVGFAAALLPGVRATRVNPAGALRAE